MLLKWQICCELFSSVWQITMEGHSVEQCVQIIKFYYKNQCSVRETFRALRDFYLRHNHPAESTIRCLVAKFESIGSINNHQHQYVAERQGLLKTSLLCVRVYGKTRGSQFLIVHKNLAFLRLQLGEFCIGTWICTPIKFNWLRNLR